MRRNSVNTASGLKTDFTIVFSDHDFGIFPLSDDICDIYFMVLCTIIICDLDLLFDLGDV